MEENKEALQTASDDGIRRFMNFVNEGNLIASEYSYHINQIDNEIEFKGHHYQSISFNGFTEEGYFKNRDCNYDLNQYEKGKIDFEDFLNELVDILSEDFFKGPVYSFKDYVFSDTKLIKIEQKEGLILSPDQALFKEYLEIFEIGNDMNFYYHKARRSNDNRKVKIPKERTELSKEEFKERLRNYLLTPDKED